MLTVPANHMQVVVAQPEQHWQTFAGPQYDGSLSGQWRRPSTHQRRLPMDERKVIAHRAMLEIDRPHAILNLGIGMPEVISKCCYLESSCASWLLLWQTSHTK